MEKDRALIDQASARADEIRASIKAGNAHYLKAGMLLKAAHDAEDWKPLGYFSFEEYMESHLNMKKSTGYDRKAVAELFGDHIAEEPRFLEIDYTRLLRLKPIIRDMTPAEVEKALYTALDASPEGFMNYVRKRKGGISTDECDHPEEMRICTRCHKRIG